MYVLTVKKVFKPFSNVLQLLLKAKKAKKEKYSYEY